MLEQQKGSPEEWPTGQERRSGQLVLVDAAVLPEVFTRVLEAKSLLSSGAVASAAEAARRAGLSRSAYYKYKDAVFPYDEGQRGRILTVHALLRDRPGILSLMLSRFAGAGANILTVNQNIPAGGAASVSISARTDHLRMPEEAFIRTLSAIDGVERIDRVTAEPAD